MSPDLHPSPAPERFHGKYRATVLNNLDPLLIGRIQVAVPAVNGVLPTTWALPCLPVAGLNHGMFWLPPIGAGVWVEFEQGDPEHPIWVGGYWGTTAEVPVNAKTLVPGVAGLVLQTTLGTALVLSDAPGPAGGIRLQTATGALITVNDTGIVISNGKGAVLAMTGPSVDVNAGALTVI